MLRSALVSLALYILSPAWATDCPQHYAAGVPPVIVKASLQARTQELCFEGYAAMHSGVSRTPLWSAEHLLRANVEAAEQLPRRNSFHPSKPSTLVSHVLIAFDMRALCVSSIVMTPASQSSAE